MFLLIILAVVIILAVMAIGTYNRLVALRQSANNAFADIDGAWRNWMRRAPKYIRRPDREVTS